MSSTVDKDEAVALLAKHEESEGDGNVVGNEQAKMGAELDMRSVKITLEAKEWMELIEMRKKWSDNILLLVSLIVVADILFVWFVGVGWLSFGEQYGPAFFIGDGVVKTLGLAYIIVKFLFNKDSMGHKQ